MKRTQEELDRIAMVWAAHLRTVWEVGPLPERIEDAAVHFAAHCQLMRKHDPD
jgi:hypothetical protein